MMDILGQYPPDTDGNVWTVVFVEAMTGYIFIHHLKSQKQHAKEFEAIALPAWLRTRNVKTDFSMYVKISPYHHITIESMATDPIRPVEWPIYPLVCVL